MEFIGPYGEPDGTPYVQGNAATGVKGSYLDVNAVKHPMEEIVHVIEEGGLTPDKNDRTQLYAAITTIISGMIATALASITTVFATVQEILTGTATKAVNVANLWSAGAFVALTDAPTIAVDLATGINFSVVLGGNRILGAASHLKEGQSGIMKVAQDATGGRTLGYAVGYKFFDGLTPDLKTTANAVNLLHYEVLPGGVVALTYIRGLA